jgi:plastocyanin
MSILMAYLAPGDVEPCAPSPDDLEKQDVPRRFRKPYPPARVPLMAPPRGAFEPFADAIGVGDYFFDQRRVVVERGDTVTWTFDGEKADHDVAVANGPYAFSSSWIRKGEFSYTFEKRGTYGLYCSLHPGLMSQQVKVD